MTRTQKYETSNQPQKEDQTLIRKTTYYWEFPADAPGYSESHFRIWWSWIPEGDPISHQEKYWINLAIRLAEIHVETSGARHTSCITIFRTLRSIAQWMCNETKASNIESIEKSDISAFEDYLSSQEISHSHAANNLYVIRYFWTYKEALGEGLKFDPYPSHGHASRIAKRIGRANRHTKTIQPKDLFHLLNHALLVIKEGSNWVNHFLAFEDLKKTRGKRRAHRHFGSEFNVRKGDINYKIKVIYGSIIAIFLLLEGTRKQTMADVTINDLENLSASSPTIKLRIRKTSSNQRGTLIERPAPKNLIDAMRLLVSITQGTREIFGGTHVFITPFINAYRAKSPERSLDPGEANRYLDALAKDAGLSLKIRPHMFRRAFSLLYCWRYEIGDLESLREMLCHKDLRHTLAYVTGDGVEDYLKDDIRSLTYHVVESSLVNGSPVGGGFGAALRRLRNIIIGSSIIAPIERAQSISERLIKSGLALIPAPQGYCAISPCRENKSVCGRKSDELFAPESRENKHCFSCSNFLVNPSFKSYWELQKSGHDAIKRSTNNDFLLRVSSEAFSQAEQVLRWIS